MKILYLKKNSVGTGSETYSDHIIRNMGKRHTINVQDYNSEIHQNWDIIHALDIKHFDLKIFSKTKCPVIIDIHDYYWIRFYPFFCIDFPLRYLFQKIRKSKYKKILLKADAVITHNDFMTTQIEHPQKYCVTLGINTKKFLPLPKKKTKMPVILFIGKDFFRKGLLTLVKAMKIIKKDFPDSKLLVLGHEYKHSLLFFKVLSKGLNVEFPGNIPNDELSEIFQNSSVFVLPSYIEAFGIVLLEAMASKVPVVATDTGGIPKVVQNNKTGITVPVADHKKLAKAIIRSLNQDFYIKKNIETAYHFVNENHTIEKMVEDLQKVYEAVKNNKTNLN